jgi:DNA-directed RNA polymerase subunit M/transcription elongation factor TFIIS
VSQTLQQPGELVVLGAESAGQETSQVRCERCGARKASFYQLQTRSADEPMTTFYRCLECGAQWRE